MMRAFFLLTAATFLGAQSAPKPSETETLKPDKAPVLAEDPKAPTKAAPMNSTPMATTPKATSTNPSATRSPSNSLSFFSDRFPFAWNKSIPMSVEVDGLKVNSIFFNVRESSSSLLRGAQFGTRAQLEVTNTSRSPKVPGFAVAVLDAEGKLIGVASGGTKVGTVKPGETETFDLNFTQVKERLPKGEFFLLSVELRN
jgi:hypothetical protein